MENIHNRIMIAKEVLRDLHYESQDIKDTIHNYIDALEAIMLNIHNYTESEINILLNNEVENCRRKIIYLIK